MITFQEMDKSCFALYDSVSPNVDVRAEYYTDPDIRDEVQLIWYLDL